MTKKCFDGVYPRDILKSIKETLQMIIVNTDPSTKTGKHWILLYFGYEVCNWKPQQNDILVCRDIVNNRNWENIQNELNNEGMENIFNTDSSLLNNIDKMTAVADPCELCCWQKDRNPSTVVMCSGAEKLCKFKYEFLTKWPEYLLSKINKT